MNSTGMNTATSDTLIDMTVKPICRAPSNAACSGGLPCSMWRTMFSIITIASSTTKPTEMVSAISEKLSSAKPSNHIAASVPAIDSGTVTPAATVGTSRRMNSSTTSSTSATVISSVISHVVDAGADRRGAVGEDGQLDVRRHPALQQRQHRA